MHRQSTTRAREHVEEQPVRQVRARRSARASPFSRTESRGQERPSQGLSGSRWNLCTRVGEERVMSGSRWWLLALGVAMAIAGCVSVSTTETDADASALPKSSLSPSPTSEGAERAIGEETVAEDYDPWAPFNTAIFSFNRKVDRYVLKPVAKAWDKIVPDPVERSLKRAFDNLSMPRRLVNNLFQLKLKAPVRNWLGSASTRPSGSLVCSTSPKFSVSRRARRTPARPWAAMAWGPGRTWCCRFCLL